MQLDFDLSEVIEEFRLLQNQVSKLKDIVAQTVTVAIYNKWRENASKGLKKTRNTYLNNLQMDRLNNGVYEITLTGSLPNMIERGVSAFDLKTGFSKSPNIKITHKNGWYLTIPFRWGTPSSLAEDEAFSGRMPMEVYQSIVLEAKKSSNPLGKTKMTFPLLPTPHNQVNVRGAFSNIETKQTFGEYTHKSPIFEGLVRQTHLYERAVQSKYNTFRRVSNNSDKNSWIHKGIQKHDFLTKSVNEVNVDALVENTVDDVLHKFGF